MFNLRAFKWVLALGASTFCLVSTVMFLYAGVVGYFLNHRQTTLEAVANLLLVILFYLLHVKWQRRVNEYER